MPKALVDELEADELDEYSDKVKTRLKQMKKVWHDERREKERYARENQEAISAAHRLLEENRALRNNLSHGEDNLIGSYRAAAEMEVAQARKNYKDAYEAGDSDKLVDAQEELMASSYKLEQLRTYRPSSQREETNVHNEPAPALPPRPDQKTVAWQERNTWWGTDEEMTASALGLHQKLSKQNGNDYVGSDEYWQSIDTTMRRRFPEYFGDDDTSSSGSNRSAARSDTRPATVVAPASRSTSSKKIVLKQSQLSIAKRLGLTPEQYAREVVKMER